VFVLLAGCSFRTTVGGTATDGPPPGHDAPLADATP
jgi:hypothetical protein